MHGGTTSCEWSRIGSRTIDRTIVRTVLRLIVRSAFGATIATIDRNIGRRSQLLDARCYDWSCDRSLQPTIDRTIGSAVECHDRSYARSQDATSARTIDRRMQRFMVPSVASRHDCWYGRSPCLIVRSVVGRNNWSYIGRWSLPLIARFHTMATAIDILQSFVIARPRVEFDPRMRPLLEIVANIPDRSHLAQSWLWLYRFHAQACQFLLIDQPVLLVFPVIFPLNLTL